MAQMEWLKAHRSKYKHLYEECGPAACGSQAKHWPSNSWEHLNYAPKCPKCLQINRARPIREVEETTGVAARTIRRWIADGKVWGEQRYGKLWYVDPDDVQRVAAESGEGARRGWPLGRPRK